MKKILLLMLGAVLIISCVACGGAAKDYKKVTMEDFVNSTNEKMKIFKEESDLYSDNTMVQEFPELSVDDFDYEDNTYTYMYGLEYISIEVNDSGFINSVIFLGDDIVTADIDFEVLMVDVVMSAVFGDELTFDIQKEMRDNESDEYTKEDEYYVFRGLFEASDGLIEYACHITIE